MLKRFLPKEEGQSMVIVVMALVGMVAMMGLVFDGGNAYLHRRKMQNASDAGAYAGARLLALRTDNSVGTNCQIRIAIESYAVRNGVPGTAPTNCTSLNPNIEAYYTDSNGNRLGNQQIGLALPINNTAAGVEVIANTSFNTFFLNIVNTSMGSVGANAKAAFAPIQSPETLMPLAVQCSSTNLSSCFNYNQNYDIFEGGGPGNFGWLSWSGDNNAPYVEYELNPNSTPPPLNGYADPRTGCSQIALGCWVQGLPGVNNSSGNRAQLDRWIGQKVTIVVYDTSAGSGSHTNYHIVGFAEFVLVGYDLPKKQITGSFVRWVVPGQACTNNCPNTGLSTLVLRQ